MRTAFADQMVETGENDESLVVVVGDISHGILREFSRKHPERYFNIGILEPAMIGIAAGMAKQGLNPVVHTIAPFLIERSFEQLKLDFGYQELSANLVSVGGSFDYSQLGVSHHSYSDVSLVSQIDDSRIFVPGSAQEFRDIFRANYAKPGLKYYRLSENPHGVDTAQLMQDAVGGVVLKSGSDFTIVTTGRSLEICLDAAEILESDISVEVLYCPILKPFDPNTLKLSVEKTKKFLFVDELSWSGGISSLLWSYVASIDGATGHRIGVEAFVRGYGEFSDLLSEAGLTATAVVEKIRRAVIG